MRSTEAEWQDFVFKIYALLMKRIDLRCLSFQLFNKYHIPKNMDLNFYNNSKVSMALVCLNTRRVINLSTFIF